MMRLVEICESSEKKNVNLGVWDQLDIWYKGEYKMMINLT